ncbi:protein kinase domain-containing protein [Paludisphaera mucosa]|uniref:Serine/threonine-protein kinase n=1 Tax=Paludisphaera mucosa TaxID=3030827 RepID=A0ABT6FKH4_9BACT|nr:serine/threonine-protein kinase [Paludisphaera mucosa]MDG3008070.1 serine/threonine-protein kinase [Paludisphaera mucosa]
MAEGASGGGWVSRQVAAMAAAWDRGEPISAAEVLERHPELDAEAAVRLIYEEVALRREAGLEVDTSEVVRRHPRWGDELRDLFACDRLIRSSGPALGADLPEAGESLGSFVLLEELGRGASGRTFLATDPTLADRPVVVKVVSDDQDEHLALAQLRHTHIVPLFSEQTIPERGLRVLCMPYLGGASLAQVLTDLAETPPGRRSGAEVLRILDRLPRTILGPPPAAGPFRRGLEGASYVDVVAWIAACLADALEYAHARGIVHMDLKPSNVLIAADGQPMLLDFHLARAPIRAGERLAGRLGGTPGWMAPEQEAAMAAIASGRPAPADVDGRADIYALGLLLRMALGVEDPGPDASRFRRPAWVGVALADVVRKCLAPAPRDRYGDAATLADDLRRQLDDLPLRGVRNRDPIERWRKWRRRHPGAFAWGIAVATTLLALAVAGGAALAVYAQRVESIRTALENGRRDLAAGRFDEALQLFGGGLEQARSLPAVGALKDALEAQIGLARRSRLAGDVHALADTVRFRHGVELPDRAEAQSLERACREIWDRRGQLLARAGPPLPPTAEARIRTDLIELAAVRIDLATRPGAGDEGRRDAAKLLDEAEADFGASFALDARRARIAGTPDESRPPNTAWEHDDRGRYLLRSGRIAEAAQAFDRALDLRPQDFWPNFYAGICAFRLGDFEAATAAFHTCAALAPEAASCPFHRGLAHEAMGQDDRAFRDYSRALELDPDLAPARLNRGILSYKAGRLDEAVADFERGVHARPDRETLGKFRHNLALARRALGDLPAARADAEAALSLGVEEARSLLDDSH